MSVDFINLDKILVDDSRYSLEKYLYESRIEPTCQITSFDTLGILYPVIVTSDDKGQYHLVDGRKRVTFARDIREKVIRATVLAEEIPASDIITLIFCNKKTLIESSIINRVQFICFSLYLNAPEEWIIDTLCTPLAFKPHRSFLRECERIFNLPVELKQFCHEKKFSLKQLLNLTYHPRELLVQIMKWQPVLHLTASILDEITSNLKDYLKLHESGIDAFLKDPFIEDLFESSLSPRDKTEKLRQYIRVKRFPVLSEVNERIEDSVDNLELPSSIQLKWDRTLENRGIDLSLRITDPEQLSGILKKITSPELKEAVESILDEL